MPDDALRIKPTKFQRGDIVLTPTGKRVQVTAVGIQADTPVFRVGKNQYWHSWQLKLQARPKFIEEL